MQPLGCDQPPRTVHPMSDAFSILTVLAYYGKADDMEGLLSDIRITLDRGQTINQWAEDLLSAHEEESESD